MSQIYANDNKIAVHVESLAKSFNSLKVFEDFSVQIPARKITAIFGPNGSGKSTLLNILSGIIPEDSGSFNLKNFNPFKFSYIFQNYRESLLPWRTNFENVAFPLRIQNISSAEIEKRVKELEEIFEFNVDKNQYPYELSGGQQQILAFIRALTVKPEILFIDEPFSALDYENNLRLREHLQKYYLAHKPTILLITHNIEEAVHLAENILVLSQKPTKIVERVYNSLPYPRALEELQSEEFHRTKDKVISAFTKTTKL